MCNWWPCPHLLMDNIALPSIVVGTQYPLATTVARVGWMSFTACGRAPRIHNLVHVSGKFEHIIIFFLLVFEKHKGCLEIVDVFILDSRKQGTLSLHHVMLWPLCPVVKTYCLALGCVGTQYPPCHFWNLVSWALIKTHGTAPRIHYLVHMQRQILVCYICFFLSISRGLYYSTMWVLRKQQWDVGNSVWMSLPMHPFKHPTVIFWGPMEQGLNVE